MKSHLQSYPCPLQINYFWNLGFLLGITIILQIITGIFLGLHYTSDLNSAYSSLFFFIREIYYGWCLRYLHSSGASFVFLFLFLHLGRAISYASYFYLVNTWFSGILLFFFLMATAFIGYVLPFGQMSFWGATVISNLLSPFPSLIEWVCGGHYVYNPSLKRFFLFHFQFPFLLCGFRILHLFYLHFLSSNNPLRNSTNNKIPFFPFIFQKDFFGFILILCLYLLQTHFGISSFSHPDNALEVCGLLTPLHIVPEWYFLCQYAMLKAVPNKNAGFIILLTSILRFHTRVEDEFYALGSVPGKGFPGLVFGMRLSLYLSRGIPKFIHFQILLLSHRMRVVLSLNESSSCAQGVLSRPGPQ